MSQPVSRLGRVLDGVGVLLFVAGALCFGTAFLGMRRLRSEQIEAPKPGGLVAFAIDQWSDFRRLSWIGIGIAAAGVTVATVAAIVHMRQRRGIARHDGSL